MIESAEEFVALRASSDPDEYGRAANDAASTDVWLDVVKERPDMRFWVAQNKTVPLEVLEVLASDNDERVRRMVASKRKLSRELFEKLARDADETIRACVARNAKVPLDVRDRLARDPSRLVREAASQRHS